MAWEAAVIGAVGSLLSEELAGRREAERYERRYRDTSRDDWEVRRWAAGIEDRRLEAAWDREDRLNAEALGFARAQFAESQRQFNWLGNQRQREFERLAAERDTYIQRRVRDARAAGVHPLFALGANAGGGVMGSGGTTVAGAYLPGSSGVPGTSAGFPGQSPTGSHVGTGLGEVARLIASEIAETQRLKAEAPERRARIRAATASAQRDEAAAAESRSRVKRAELEANSTRPARAGVEVTALGEDIPLRERTLENLPNRSYPLMVRAYRADGTYIDVVNPELGADEINQAILAHDYARRGVSGVVSRIMGE